MRTGISLTAAFFLMVAPAMVQASSQRAGEFSQNLRAQSSMIVLAESSDNNASGDVAPPMVGSDAGTGQDAEEKENDADNEDDSKENNNDDAANQDQNAATGMGGGFVNPDVPQAGMDAPPAGMDAPQAGMDAPQVPGTMSVYPQPQNPYQ
jgi:hypothetical protein